MPRKKTPAAKFTTEVEESLWDIVLWAAKNLGQPLTAEECGSATRFEFLQWASDPTNKKEFFKSLYPQAQAAYDAANKGEEDSVVEREEKKSVAELKVILEEAIGEAITPYRTPASIEDLLK